MRGVVIYKSTYGSTREYAEWIAKDTGLFLYSHKDVKKEEIIKSKIVVIGCPVIAMRPSLTRFIKKHWKILRNKKIILFTTSGVSPESKDLIKGYNSAFSEEIRKKIKYFPLGGRCIISKMNWFHRMMMKVAIKMEKNPKKKKEMGRDVDWVKRSNIKPIVNYIKKISK